MARSVNQYAGVLRRLLPIGRAWRQEAGSTLDRLLRALAGELERLDGRSQRLLSEADPRTAIELLPDWERVLGLPMPCVDAPLTVHQRQVAAGQKIAMQGGASRQYFIGLAAAHGYAITITEPSAYRWTVHAPDTTRFFRHVGDQCGGPFSTFGNDQLECLMHTYKPAHTRVTIVYGA